jgi:drug/metabolite transporter (DMT)-like permease
MKGKSKMTWLILAFAAALSWGAYGAFLHRGQVALGSPMKALLCVGIAYFLIGVLVPAGILASQGELKGFNLVGSSTATAAGALGAIGAVAIIYAFKAGGLPNYVMPLVFGGAPLINVVVTMAIHPPKETPNPLLWIGYLLAAGGASLVLYYRPAN